ncbi:GDSL-type esterase/lipase family protein [Citrobacter europaeus]|uniref:GDSL-type esterase/lipase family protein n=1 Tax=Citrobacter europaeus TaxID=1914243 RepID=UPI0039C319ED
MTVSTEVDHNEYTGNGVTTSFPYTFRIFNKSDLFVQIVDLDENITDLILDTDYTVTGAGGYTGGSVILSEPLANGRKISISRSLPVTQETDLRNQGKFFAEVHEDAFDKLTMLIQQTYGWLRRALLKPSFIASYYDAKQDRIANLADPVSQQDAVNNRSMRSYVDQAIAGVVGGFGWFIQSGAGAVYRTFQDKMRDNVAAKDFGSAGGDSGDKKANLDNAISLFGYSGNGASIYLDPGRHLISSQLTNPAGVEFDGPGVIGIPDGNSSAGTPEIWQQNSYADKHKYCFGDEYMYAYYHATRTDNATPGGLLKCVLAGDSTMHGGNGEPIDYRPDVLLSEMFRLNGIPNIGVYNRAVPSTSWGDMDIISDLGATTRLLMIKYGVNDAFGPKDQRHQNMANAMRSKLQEIRSQPFGGLEWLTIILVGPNSTNDSPFMRNEEWYESIRGIYASVAREFKCVYFDTYAFLRDSRVAAGLWMDNPFNDGRAIHPLSEMNLWIYGRLFNEVLSPSMIYKISLNSKVNLPLHVESIGINDLPLASVFKWNTNWHQANTANGFDFSGHAVTTRHADGFVNQTVMNQANSRIQHRSKPIATNTWNKFTGKPYPLGLGNGWVDYGSNFNSATATLTLDGSIVLSGTIKSGTTGVGDAIFSLPGGLTPKGISRHAVVTNTTPAIGFIEIRQNGQCVIVSGISNTFVSLEGITVQLA